MSDDLMRLQRFLARAGVVSRRHAEKLIEAGRVSVNGQVVTQLGTKVAPSQDSVALDGKPCTLPDDPVFLMLNKPAGVLTTMYDPQRRPCVAALVPTKTYPGLFPVGRLDKDTTGLLLFSTDGNIANDLLHPSRHVSKTYLVQVQGPLASAELDPLRTGIRLEDGMCAPARCQLLDKKTVRITIHEGRKRQVKRMFLAIGHPVVRLHREKFGPFTLGDLPEGQWRLLDSSEIEALSTHLSTRLCTHPSTHTKLGISK